METITKLEFFIRNLHWQLKEFYREQSDDFKDNFVTYRRQRLNEEAFNRLYNAKGELLSFSNILSTSRLLLYNFIESIS